MNSNVKKMMMTAAVTGLFAGTSVRLNAAPAPAKTDNAASVSAAKNMAGKLSYTKVQDTDTAKHSCKGKNDCKGQGGCKSSDNGCKAKNSCKGKGGCATDGSKMPKKLA